MLFILLWLLRAKIFLNKAVPSNTFVAYLTDKKNNGYIKEQLWGKEGKDLPASKFHRLMLILFSLGAITLNIHAAKQIGKGEYIKLKDVDVTLGTCCVETDEGDEMDDLVMSQETTFSNFAF